ncbi:Uncharacterised protein [Segatella copri]|nr:Uncharacterised protein [Segatella copri]
MIFIKHKLKVLFSQISWSISVFFSPPDESQVILRTNFIFIIVIQKYGMNINFFRCKCMIQTL